MLTIYETPTFVDEAAKLWSTEERLEFFSWIASEPEAGSVIAGSGGCRKVRWARPGMGKQGGVRVIYFTHLMPANCACCWSIPNPPETAFPDTSSRTSARRSKVIARKSTKRLSSGEELGLKLLQSVRQMKARQFARTTQVEVNEVVQARQSTGLSQAEFASVLSISRRTLQEWEQGRRSPSGAAQALIRIARKHPEIVREALA